MRNVFTGPIATIARPLIATLWILISASTTCADGHIFPVIDHAATIPDQQALIVWDQASRTETLVVETRFTGTGDRFAWVVPLPSPPTIAPATRGLFPTLQQLTAPRVEYARWSGQVLVLVIAAAVITLALLLPGRRLLRYVLIAFTVLVSFASMLPTLGSSRGAESGITILDRTIVGSYDTVTLKGTTGAVVCEWLTREGFATPADATPVLDAYAKDGWCFVASTLRISASGVEPLTPHPLAMTFTTASPVYPMRLTAVGSSGLSLDLYVIADERASAIGLSASRCAMLKPDPAQSITEEVIPLRHPGLQTLAGSHAVLTRLSGRLSSAEMTRDIPITLTPFVATRLVVFPPETIARIAALSSVGVLLFGFTIVAWRRYRLRQRGVTTPHWSRSPAVLAVLTCGLLAGATVWATVPTSTFTTSSRARHAVSNAERLGSVIQADIDRGDLRFEPRDTSDQHLARLRAWIAKSPNYRKPIGEEDSPGGYTLGLSGDTLQYTAYDHVGAPTTQDLTPFSVRKDH